MRDSPNLPGRRRTASAAFVGLALAFASGPAWAQPETPGPYPVEVWTSPPGAPVPCDAGIFHPTGAACPGAPLALVHGYLESGVQKTEVAKLLASNGFVVAAPTLNGQLTNPSQADADAINALLEWMVQQSATPGTPISGKIDPTAYGVAGHSNGGVVFWAAAANPKIKAIIGWDAVAAVSSTGGLHGPSLQLIAPTKGNCSGSPETAYQNAPPPKAMANVIGASHCDFDDPANPFCPIACGTTAANAAAMKMIERYSVAWFTCLLGHDPSMQQWVDYSVPMEGLQGQQASGSITCQAACAGGGTGGAGGSSVGGSAGASAGGTGVGGAGAAGVGGSGAVAGTGVGGGGNVPGCTAPVCGACAGCYDFCVCDTGKAEFCAQTCGVPSGSGGSDAAAADADSSDSGGCGCRVAGEERGDALGVIAALCVALGVRRRRARQRGPITA